MSETLVVNEVYLSLQGESTFAGLPCVFVRLTACNLRCSYCDTAYAFTEGKKRDLSEVRDDVLRLAKPYSLHQPSTLNHQLPLVELTGGDVRRELVSPTVRTLRVCQGSPHPAPLARTIVWLRWSESQR